MSRVPLGWGWTVILAWAMLPQAVQAQFVTRWINANGVVTFSTSPPPPGVKYEAIHLPSYRARAADSDQGDGSGSTNPNAAGTTPPKSGPAQLEVKDHSTTSLGDTQWLLAGKVKNEGGTAADGVGIRISVLEDGQGNPCLEDQGSVNPSTLQPGETGTFELTFDSPCFFGGPAIDIVAEAKQ